MVQFVETADGRKIELAADEYIVGLDELRERDEERVVHVLRWLQTAGVVDARLDVLELEAAYWHTGGWDKPTA